MRTTRLINPAVPSEDEGEREREREEAEVPLRRKRSAYRRARTEFATPAFEQFQSHLSAGGSSSHSSIESAVRRWKRLRKQDNTLVSRMWRFTVTGEDLAQADVPIVFRHKRARGN
ncbi:hypothetical protein Tco_0992593 [Tanacetum coccineum]|uniref:Uncharacterized protein n=1 Tax=Tanacetum coccineum TaxID=301880 RepID=A0ABQ5F312_9ASTR